jgi:hypothetical protein
VVTVTPGAHIPLDVVEGTRALIALRLRAREPGLLRLSLGEASREFFFDATGERRVELLGQDAATCDALPVLAEILPEGPKLAFTLDCRVVGLDEARANLRLVSAEFPADAGGRRDLARPAGLVTLPSRVWRRLLSVAGLGVRPRSDQAPWAHRVLELENLGPRDVSLVIQSGVVDAQGRPVRAFRPRLRESDGQIDAVSALLRVPAGGRASAVLPLYVDDADPALDENRHEPWFLRASATPVGASEALLVDERPLHVRRGCSWASAGLMLGVAGAIGGLLLLLLRLRAWFGALSTTELVTISLFGSLSFVVGTAAWLVGMASGTLLGPFAPLVTGLLDDTFRTVLMAALLVLLPRPGVASLALLVGYLLRGLSFGAFHPLDLLSLGSTLFFLESSLWLVGITRSPGWRDAPPFARWLRLAAGLGPPALLTMLVSLSSAVVFYRLYYADFYVLLMLALPGFLYVVLAAALGLPFAQGLRDVDA